MSVYKRGDFGIFPANQLKGLSPYCQVVMAWLIFHTNQSGKCFPSLKTLCDEAGISKAKLARVLDELENMRLIARVKRAKSSGQQTSTMYEVFKSATVSHKDSHCLSQRQPTVSDGDTNHKKSEPEKDNHNKDIKKSEDQSAEKSGGGEKKGTPQPPSENSSQDVKLPGQRGYDPATAHTFTDEMSDRECAIKLSELMISKAAEAYGIHLIARPADQVKHFVMLFKSGVTASECRRTLEWLYTVNATSQCRFVVQSGASLRKKWDSIQASMSRGSSGRGPQGSEDI